jgi:hypothetical protein
LARGRTVAAAADLIEPWWLAMMLSLSLSLSIGSSLDRRLWENKCTLSTTMPSFTQRQCRGTMIAGQCQSKTDAKTEKENKRESEKEQKRQSTLLPTKRP